MFGTLFSLNAQKRGGVSHPPLSLNLPFGIDFILLFLYVYLLRLAAASGSSASSAKIPTPAEQPLLEPPEGFGAFASFIAIATGSITLPVVLS